MTGTTRGHALLAAWLIERGGASRRNPARPYYPEIQKFLVELNHEVLLVDPAARPRRSAISIYDLLPGAAPPVSPTRRWRIGIERMSRGRVPAVAWDEADAKADDEPSDGATGAA